ncbi:MAG: NAD-dependent epimerase/dehydratase family protein [Alphaproteobacteria bacterium]
MIKTLAITAPTSWIGLALTQEALNQGYRVLGLGRRDPLLRHSDFTYVPYNLKQEHAPKILGSADALIHLAAVMGKGTPDSATIPQEVRSACALRQALPASAPMIFVSSAAAANASSGYRYAVAKAQIEDALLATMLPVVNVRPGLVYGPGTPSAFGMLCRVVAKLPILPDFLPRSYIQYIHIQELIVALLKLLTIKAPYPKAPVFLANPTPISLKELLQKIAHVRYHKHSLFVPIPRAAVLAFLKLLGSGMYQPLDSLLHAHCVDSRIWWDDLVGSAAIPFIEGLSQNA